MQLVSDKITDPEPQSADQLAELFQMFDRVSLRQSLCLRGWKRSGEAAWKEDRPQWKWMHDGEAGAEYQAGSSPPLSGAPPPACTWKTFLCLCVRKGLPELLPGSLRRTSSVFNFPCGWDEVEQGDVRLFLQRCSLPVGRGGFGAVSRGQKPRRVGRNGSEVRRA